MLEDLVEQEPGKVLGWVEFRDGLEFQIEFIGQQRLSEINRKCTKVFWKRHERFEELDEQALREEFSQIIHDWRGLGKHNVHKFVALRAGADVPETIPFSKAGLKWIMDQAAGFDNFLINAVTDIERINQGRIEEEKKTLKPISKESLPGKEILESEYVKAGSGSG